MSNTRAGDDDWGRLEELFSEALVRDPAERAVYLDEVCAGDVALRRELDELLAADAADADDDHDLEPSAAELLSALEGAQADALVGSRLGPWTLGRLIGSGGMGRVYLATRSAADFEQRAAVKLIRSGLVSEDLAQRFRHERATLARLEHPGIARLLDGGANAEGLPWLAMEYVDGEPLDSWCDARRLSVDERLTLFLGVCEAVAFAHSQLVIHRDLKPSNIFVDAAGKPRLLDFGVAKVLEPDGDVSLTATAGGPLTPAYASPEQVLGTAVGIGTDVYALGVILYELLSGSRPYRLDDQTAAGWQRAICEELPQRPSTVVMREESGQGFGKASQPLPAAELTPAGRRSTTVPRLKTRLAGELDNIVLMALAKEPERRYPSVVALADDIARHQAGLPVLAHAPSMLYSARKFVTRHKAACALAAALLLAVVGAVASFVSGLRRDQGRLADILRLSDGYALADLVAEADGPLWPVQQDSAAAIDDWLLRAAELLQRRAQHEDELARLNAVVAGGEASADNLWWQAQLRSLLEGLAQFAEPEPFGTTVMSMQRRRQLVDELRRDSLVEAAADWQDAIASIGDRGACPQYDGLVLEPQWGLAPLHRDPASGLWEFWVVASGERPQLRDGSPLMVDASALVLVLLPGGPALMGSQNVDPGQAHFDAASEQDERPVHGLELAPFFLSKYEMTQGQWQRLSGSNPSRWWPGSYAVHPTSLAHPVEQLSWYEATEQLRRLGLVLPTELRWEYACRAGTDTPWSSGDLAGALDRVANLADLYARDHHGSEAWNYDAAQTFGLDDGQTIHAPVGSFAANAFGLHDVHGNVWEWCLDMPAPYIIELAEGDGARIIPAEVGELDTRILRGGAFSNPPSRARSATRWSAVRGFRSEVAGLRPARSVQ